MLVLINVSGRIAVDGVAFGPLVMTFAMINKAQAPGSSVGGKSVCVCVCGYVT